MLKMSFLGDDVESFFRGCGTQIPIEIDGCADEDQLEAIAVLQSFEVIHQISNNSSILNANPDALLCCRTMTGITVSAIRTSATVEKS